MKNNQSPQGVEGLKKHDIKPLSVAFMLYCLVAAGAFGIEEMISSSGPGLTMAMLMIFAIIWALPISNLVAEMGALLPSTGGLYVWTKKAFGEFWGFQSGWWLTLAIYLSNGSFIALIVGYTSHLIPMNATQQFMLKIAVICIFTIINLMGIKEVSNVTNLLSILVMSAFALVAIVGFANWQHNPVVPFIPEESTLLESIGNCICLCLWMYCGYECIANISGEVKNPKAIPKGLLIAMPIIAASYLLPTTAALASIGPWENWTTNAALNSGGIGYSTVLTTYLGPIFGYVFLVISIIAQCALFNTYVAVGSRGFFVMADDHLFPRSILKVSKKRGVPYIGVLSVSVVALLTTSFDFTTLAVMTVVFMLAVYFVVAIAAVKLRKIYPVEDRENLYVVPGGKIGFSLAVGLVIFIVVFSLMVNGTDYLLIGLAGMSTGPVFYVIFKRIYGGLSKSEPKLYPLNPKTKLAIGDIKNIGIYMTAVGIIGFIGQFFIAWYEGDWGPEYYAEVWGSGLLSNFDQMLQIMKVGGFIVLVAGLIIYFIGKKVDRQL